MMRFNCGTETRRATAAKKYKERVNKPYEWNRWFAWRPVNVTRTDECVWWEWVERKRDYDPHDVGCMWHYRPVKGTSNLEIDLWL